MKKFYKIYPSLLEKIIKARFTVYIYYIEVIFTSMKNHETSRAITKNEYERLIRHLADKFWNTTSPNRKFVYLRDACLYSMMWNIGLRPKESYGAKLSDIRLEDRLFFVDSSRNKTRKPRIRKIPKSIVKLLEKYLCIRKSLFQRNKYLFPSISGKCISRRTLQINFERVLRNLGLLEIEYVDKRGIPRYTINLYSFRKGHATYLYEETGDPYIVKESLDHKNIETTIKFYIKTMPGKTQDRICSVFN